ncbi:MAG: hypothetical protein HF975_01355 [ANME-2 cluster archaeon]|nr:hypothetical protein [ANME-2 cluster archaeon]
MVYKISGTAEQEAAEYIREHVTKPVVGYVVGISTPPGKTMSHAGAIISRGRRDCEGEDRDAGGCGGCSSTAIPGLLFCFHPSGLE